VVIKALLIEGLLFIGLLTRLVFRAACDLFRLVFASLRLPCCTCKLSMLSLHHGSLRSTFSPAKARRIGDYTLST
jgi:hypothetical protein